MNSSLGGKSKAHGPAEELAGMGVGATGKTSPEPWTLAGGLLPEYEGGEAGSENEKMGYFGSASNISLRETRN